MEYFEFEKLLAQYDELYRQGMKKQADLCISKSADTLNMLNETQKDTLLRSFIGELCDGTKFDFLKNRGNGRIPYALDQIIKEWMSDRCNSGQMPEMRWFYELYRNDVHSYEQAYQFLKSAYEHPECDEKTVSLLFRSYLEDLDFGAHHFPEGCVIGEEDANSAFRLCEKIIAEKTVGKDLKERLEYYKTLYSCFENYCKNGKDRDFELYCNEAGIKFST